MKILEAIIKIPVSSQEVSDQSEGGRYTFVNCWSQNRKSQHHCIQSALLVT